MTAGLVISPAWADRSRIYPTDVTGQIWSDIGAFDEPSFWRSADIGKFEARYRLSVSGIACRSYVFRIDVIKGGGAKGVVKSRDRCRSRAGLVNARRFFVKPNDMRRLAEAFNGANLWRVYPEFWVDNDPDAICIDGEELVFERVDDAGYRISSAIAQCTAPQPLLEAAREFMIISGERNALHLLN